jgi:hypothetical protein
MVGIIYKYTSPSNKSYIGQTIHEHTRYMRHKRMEWDNKFHRAKNRQRDSKGHFIKNN